jgi:hypothetical protein
VTYQGPPPPRSAHPYGRDLPDDDYAAAPPRMPQRTRVGPARRGGRSRWFWPAIGLAVVGAVVVVVAVVHGGGSSSAGQQPGVLITTFMPGEIQRVPAACTAVPNAVLDRYLPGRSKPAAAQPLVGKAASQCSWTVDRPGMYRFMELAVEAYNPNGLASGDGSATRAAGDAFVAARLAKQFPLRKSQDPKAIVTVVPGLGQEAFSADQHFRRGALLDMVTLVARYRNVLVTVIFEARTGGGFGADPVSTLNAGAQAAARAALTGLR